MGLTIHYKLTVKENVPSATVRELVERAARYAGEIGCAEVGEMFHVEPDFPLTSLFIRTGDQEDGFFADVPASDGWLVPVSPGDGCETMFLALCQYPRQISFHGKSLATGYTGGWMFQGHCKTQFAAEHGWEHFLWCHKAVIQILDFCRQLGVTVEVTDEGNFWDTCSEEKLRATLQKYDGLLASVAGALKDAGNSVGSPIFERNDFERLEAAGQQEFREQLKELARVQDEVDKHRPK